MIENDEIIGLVALFRNRIFDPLSHVEMQRHGINLKHDIKR